MQGHLANQVDLQHAQIQLLSEACRQLSDKIAESKTDTKKKYYRKKLHNVLKELVLHDRKAQLFSQILSESKNPDTTDVQNAE